MARRRRETPKLWKIEDIAAFFDACCPFWVDYHLYYEKTIYNWDEIGHDVRAWFSRDDTSTKFYQEFNTSKPLLRQLMVRNFQGYVDQVALGKMAALVELSIPLQPTPTRVEFGVTDGKASRKLLSKNLDYERSL